MSLKNKMSKEIPYLATSDKIWKKEATPQQCINEEKKIE